MILVLLKKHGGTLFCVAYRGGKRCAFPECTKSARGRTDYCVRHGCGKRCKFEGCGKSAQGSTNLCKAYGGGKRCSWGQPGSEFGIGEDICSSIVHEKTGLCVSHGALVQDKRVHGGATLGAIVQDSEPRKPDKLKQALAAQDLSADIVNMGSNFVTSLSGSSWKSEDSINASMPRVPKNAVAMPEGRVHSGSLMAMLVGILVSISEVAAAVMIS